MRIFGRKKENLKGEEPVQIAVIQNTVSSEIFQDILKRNDIPFVCRQQGAGGYLKIVTGGLFSADIIYVSEKNAQEARKLYEAYLETEVSESCGEE